MARVVVQVMTQVMAQALRFAPKRGKAAAPAIAVAKPADAA